MIKKENTTKKEPLVPKPIQISILPETQKYLVEIKKEIKNIYGEDLKGYDQILLFLVNNYYKK